MDNPITYSTSKTDLAHLEIKGFFEEWPQKPNEDTLKKSIEGSDFIVLAIDSKNHRLAGYITAISDQVLSAYIPFLEVGKSYQGNGIGRMLLNTLLKELDHLYMIDIVCDEKLANFYKKEGFTPWQAMIKRNYSNIKS